LSCSAGAKRWGGDSADKHGAIKVSKRKDSIALFEVIKNRRNDVNLNVPKWMGGQGADAAQDPATASEPPQVEPPPVPQAEPAPAPEASALRTDESGQLTLKVSQRQLILAGTGLVLLVLLAGLIGYALGGGSGTPENPNPGGALKDRVPPGKHVVAGQSGGPGKGSPGGSKGLPAAAARRIQGKYYLIIQRLNGATTKDNNEGQRIKAWLANQGVPATVETYTTRSKKKYYMVWSLRGFDNPRSQAAQDYGKRIEGLGKKYFSEYKTYNFLQRHDGKYDPWFYRHP